MIGVCIATSQRALRGVGHGLLEQGEEVEGIGLGRACSLRGEGGGERPARRWRAVGRE